MTGNFYLESPDQNSEADNRHFLMYNLRNKKGIDNHFTIISPLEIYTIILF